MAALYPYYSTTFTSVVLFLYREADFCVNTLLPLLL